MDLYGDAAGTTMTLNSPIRREIGVTVPEVSGDLLVSGAPTVTAPATSRALVLPFSLLTNCAMPMAPPAPALFSTTTFLAWPEACSASPRVRAMVSKPPPGLAGAMILNCSTWAWAAIGARATRQETSRACRFMSLSSVVVQQCCGTTRNTSSDGTIVHFCQLPP